MRAQSCTERTMSCRLAAQMGRSAPRELSSSSSPSPFSSGWPPASRAAPPRLPCREANETRAATADPPRPRGRFVPSRSRTTSAAASWVADTGNDAIRRVLANGVIGTLAGLGVPGYSGDGGPAIAARLNAPADVAAAPGGAVLIADAGNGVIRRVSAKGVITTVAGAPPGAAAGAPSATPAYARSVRLSNPQGVAALPGGGFLIADTGNSVVEVVTPGGLLSVVAGIGAPGNSGDGGPAQAAALNLPTRVVATADGGYLILDLGNLVVRRVSRSATISTVPGSQTSPNTPFGVALNPGGLAQDAAGNEQYANQRSRGQNHDVLLVACGVLREPTGIEGHAERGAGRGLAPGDGADRRAARHLAHHRLPRSRIR